MAVSTYEILIANNRPLLEAAVTAVLATKTPLGAPFETTSGQWAQAVVTEVP